MRKKYRAERATPDVLRSRKGTMGEECSDKQSGSGVGWMGWGVKGERGDKNGDNTPAHKGPARTDAIGNPKEAMSREQIKVGGNRRGRRRVS